MTKPYTILLAVAAIVSTVVEAKDCTEGLNYCGHVLANKGTYLYFYSSDSELTMGSARWYPEEIDRELMRVNILQSDYYRKQSIFTCKKDGLIRWKTHCAHCIDGGSGKSDYCKED
jgi:hypothetical protein